MEVTGKSQNCKSGGGEITEIFNNNSESNTGDKFEKATDNSKNMYLITDKTDRYSRFIYLTACIMLFFGLHNYMQELIMSQPGFKFGVVLGYLEVLGVSLCSFAERQYKGESGRKAPLPTYFFLCFLLLISSAASNIALNYINYPTKVVFRSCKLVPTMIISTFVNKKRVSNYEYICGALISAGMVLFAFADFTVYPNYHLIGIFLVSLSVVADAFLPNYQEKVYSQGSNELEVTFYTNILSLVAMTVTFYSTGELSEALVYTLANPHCLYLLIIYTFLAYIAIMYHMTLIKEFGAITGVLVGNTRKALTIVISFMLFPKPYSILYVIGGLLVFGSLIAQGVIKENMSGGKRDKAESSSDKWNKDAEHVSDGQFKSTNYVKSV